MKAKRDADLLAPVHAWLVEVLGGNVQQPAFALVDVLRACDHDLPLAKALSILDYIHHAIVDVEQADSEKDYESELLRNSRGAAESMRETASLTGRAARNLCHALVASYERDPSSFRFALGIAHRAYSLGSATLDHVLTVGTPAHDRGAADLLSRAKGTNATRKLPRSDSRILSELSELEVKHPGLKKEAYHQMLEDRYHAKAGTVKKRMTVIRKASIR